MYWTYKALYITAGFFLNGRTHKFLKYFHQLSFLGVSTNFLSLP